MKRKIITILIIMLFNTTQLFSQITNVSPPLNAVNISRFSSISISFNQVIDTNTVSTSTFNIQGNISGLHTGSIQFNSDMKQIVFVPIKIFAAGEEVLVNISSSVKMINGDSLINGFHYRFFTKVDSSLGQFQKQDYSIGWGTIPNPIVVSDLDSDGDADMAIGCEDFNRVNLYKNNGKGLFEIYAISWVSSLPYCIKSADLDHDGDLDLALTNRGSNSVSILINNGDGLFQSASNYAVGTQPLFLVPTDLDGDGDLDLAVTNYISKSISILKNNGNGIFQPKIDITLEDKPIFITAADLDTDGDEDLVVGIDYSSKIFIFKNNGDGSFLPKISYVVGNTPLGLSAIDLNGDNILDLAIANNLDNSISILIGNGDGSFQPQSLYSVGSVPFCIATSDLDGDGDIDIANTNYNGNSISILKNNGNGTFSPSVQYNVGNLPTGITSADINNNGDLEIIVTNYGSYSYSILSNKGGPLTSHIINVNPSVNTMNSSPDISISVKFKQPVIPSTVNESTLVVFGSISGRHLGQITLSSNNSQIFFDPIISFIKGEKVTVCITKNIQIAGVVDTFKGFQWSFYTKTTFSNGQFSQRATYPVGGSPQGIFTADLNNDIYPDICVANYFDDTFSVLLNSQGGTFQTKVDYSTNTHPTAIMGADIDSDGDIDIGVTNSGSSSISIFKNNGDGTFQQKIDYNSRNRPWWLCFSDVQNDGKTDLIVANGDGQNEKIACSIFSSDFGTFGQRIDNDIDFHPIHEGVKLYEWVFNIQKNNIEMTNPVILSYVGYQNHTALLLTGTSLDTLHDLSIPLVGGRIEIPPLQTNYVCLAINFLINLPYSCMVVGHNEYGIIHVREKVSSNSMEIGDIDNDGILDAFFSPGFEYYSNNYISIFNGNGNTSFFKKTNYYSGIGSYSLGTGDFNNDGYLDFAVTNYFDHNLTIYLNNRNGIFFASSSYETEKWPYSICVTDVNGDEKLDIAVCNTNQSSISIFKGNGDGTFQSKINYPCGSSPWNIVAADFNLDGDEDLVVSNINLNAITILSNNYFGSLVNLKTFLEGSYNNSSMNTTLNSSGLIPLNSHNAYDTVAYGYTSSSVQSIPNSNIVDWVLVELRTGTPSNTKVAARAGFIKSDGTIVDIDGTSPLTFTNVSEGNYYVVVRHRNHLSIMSSSAIALTSSSSLYDFTTGQDKAYGTSPMVDLGGGIYGMRGGDVNGSGIITFSDITEIITRNNQTGYYSADVNMSGIVTFSDITKIISNNNSSTQVP